MNGEGGYQVFNLKQGISGEFEMCQVKMEGGKLMDGASGRENSFFIKPPDFCNEAKTNNAVSDFVNHREEGGEEGEIDCGIFPCRGFLCRVLQIANRDVRLITLLGGFRRTRSRSLGFLMKGSPCFTMFLGDACRFDLVFRV